MLVRGGWWGGVGGGGGWGGGGGVGVGCERRGGLRNPDGHTSSEKKSQVNGSFKKKGASGAIHTQCENGLGRGRALLRNTSENGELKKKGGKG